MSICNIAILKCMSSLRNFTKFYKLLGKILKTVTVIKVIGRNNTRVVVPTTTYYIVRMGEKLPKKPTKYSGYFHISGG